VDRMGEDVPKEQDSKEVCDGLVNRGKLIRCGGGKIVIEAEKHWGRSTFKVGGFHNMR